MLATDPEVLLLDEPSSGMGPEEAHQLGDTLLDLRRDFGLSIMMIEHHVPLVVRVCDHVYCLDFGQLLTHGTPDEVRRHPQVVAAYLGEDPDPDVVALEDAARRARGDRLMALLEVEELRVGYGFPVLLGIDFEVGRARRPCCSGSTAPARRRRCRRSPGCSSRTAGRSASTATRIDGQVRRRGSCATASPSCPRGGACSRRSASPTTCASAGGRAGAARLTSISSASSSSSTSRGSPSAPTRTPGRCPAASSRCWRSAGR